MELLQSLAPVQLNLCSILITMNNNSKALILAVTNLLCGLGIYTIIAWVITMRFIENYGSFREAWDSSEAGIVALLIGIPVTVILTLALMTYIAEAKFGLRHALRNVLFVNTIGLGAGIGITCISRGYIGVPVGFIAYYLAYNTRLNADPTIRRN